VERLKLFLYCVWHVEQILFAIPGLYYVTYQLFIYLPNTGQLQLTNFNSLLQICIHSNVTAKYVDSQ